MNIIKRGSNYFIKCPFHSESDASCVINFSKGIYHCFSCGASGNIEDIFGHKDFTFDRVELQKEKLLSLIAKQLIAKNENKWYNIEENFRGIDKKIYRKFKIKEQEDIIRFPLFKYNRIIGYYFYNKETKEKRIELLPKQTLYPQYEKNIKIGEYLIIVEGLFDMLKVYQLDYNVVALVNFSCYRHLPALIKEYSLSKIYLMLDSDNAGETTMKKMEQMLTDIGIPFKKIQLPKGIDPAECWDLKERLEKVIKENK